MGTVMVADWRSMVTWVAASSLGNRCFNTRKRWRREQSREKDDGDSVARRYKNSRILAVSAVAAVEDGQIFDDIEAFRIMNGILVWRDIVLVDD
ncbi:hypothetical protein CDL15_Pgr012141 [Punica granatum]|uniref:Uncharacterized protein n=1 Tax=Punica granatum TaxID=22663 RepID=A0A218XN25_PUNGR|nr:hypothetical protein CDL15_Pgr012141 [Punica granatum]PKI64126.1 hypothetical protein CRG98_015470 [Punica granatum]